MLRTLTRPTDPATLAVLRIVFGVLMLGQVGSSLWGVKADFPAWEYVASYPWGLTADAFGMPAELRLGLMLGTAVLIGIGLFTRAAAGLFCILYAMTFLLDPTRFNNHDYLIALLAGWLVVVRANACWSLDARFGRVARETIPFWHVAAIRAQLGIVYFCGGLAKLNGDWLQGEPVAVWVAQECDLWVIGPLLAERWVGLFVAWFGLVFDLVLPFVLLWRPTRWAAIGVATLFHLANSQLFDIGVFPWLGIASLVVFLNPSTPRRWFGGTAPPSDVPKTAKSPTVHRDVLVALAMVAVVQLLLPFRHFLHEGRVEWNREGKPFSWRMMLSHANTFVGMQVLDESTGVAFEVDQFGFLLTPAGHSPGTRMLLVARGQPYLVPSRLLHARQKQSKGVWGNPRLLAAYARFIAEEARILSIERPRIRIDAVCSLNGRPFQRLVDPKVDYATAPIPWWGTPEWVVPLKPGQPGDYPFTTEEKHRRVMAVLLGEGASQRPPPSRQSMEQEPGVPQARFHTSPSRGTR